jgi:hypothetical protein
MIDRWCRASLGESQLGRAEGGEEIYAVYVQRTEGTIEMI